MLDHAHAPPVREKMPTLPVDLSEYAHRETGPESWSARCDSDALVAWLHDSQSDEDRSVVTELLVTISPVDVPRLAVSASLLIDRLSLREAFVLASIDGESTLESLIDSLDLPHGEALSIICELCAAGVLTLTRG